MSPPPSFFFTFFFLLLKVGTYTNLMWFYIDSCSPFRQRRVYNRNYRTTRTGRRTKLWRWSTTWCSTRPTATPSSTESIRESTVYFESFTFYIQIVPSVLLRILKLITKFTIWQLVVILDRRKGDRDVLLSNRLAICRCFLHDECIKAFVVSVLSKWQNYIRPSYFYVVIYKKNMCRHIDLLMYCLSVDKFKYHDKHVHQTLHMWGSAIFSNKQ